MNNDINTKHKSRKKVREMWNLDWLVTLFTFGIIIAGLYFLVFITVHTRIDITKSEKGEINLIVDYDKESEYNVPGKDLLPMAKDVWSVVKEKLEGTSQE